MIPLFASIRDIGSGGVWAFLLSIYAKTLDTALEPIASMNTIEVDIRKPVAVLSI